MADKEILIKKRDSINLKLVIFENFVNKVDSSIQINGEAESVDLIELEHRIASSIKLLELFDEFQMGIEGAVAASEKQAQFEEREKFETLYYSTVARAKHIIASFTQNVEIVTEEKPVEPTSTATPHQNIKLPTIELPKFNGELEAWLGFRDLFESLIHKNEAINNIQKFHYLRAALTGEAASVIGSLEFVSTNYEIAWEILCERYNNTRLLIRNHIRALFNMESIAKENSGQIKQMLDMLNKHLRALNILGQPTQEWDTLIIYLVSTKLDSSTLREWEQFNKTNDIPTFETLKEFLKSRADLLETLDQGKSQPNKNLTRQPAHRQHVKSFFVKKPECVVCKKEHYIQNCSEFLKLNINDRIAKVKELQLCNNCLRNNHYVKDCRSRPCPTCKYKHNILLHIKKEDSQEISKENETVALTLQTSSEYKHILLSTAVVLVLDKFKKYHKARVLLDTGSQSNFISDSLCDKLQLNKTNININVGGLNETRSVIRNKCTVKIKAQHYNYNKTISCLVMSDITGNLPNFYIQREVLDIPPHLDLADPLFDKCDKIDMLLGAELFWDLTCVGQIKLEKGPILQKTLLGWILSGPIYGTSKGCDVQCNFSKNLNLESQLAKFWEFEECSNSQLLSTEEKACEEHFVRTTYRNETGRFIVSIPLKGDISMLGESKTLANKRFLSLERKLNNNKTFREQYVKFIHEYISLGHMEKIEGNKREEFSYFLPHHGVLKEDSTTTKLRVVYDASAVTSSGFSLNNLQMVGPTIQQDLLSILLRFRKYTYVLAADIEKMYRQVLIKPDECHLQRILWRENPQSPLDIYELKTVTYGMAAAAFLAIRCLYQLGLDVETKSPIVARIIKEDFYVDDLLTGADSFQDIKNIAQQLKGTLKSGGFNLRKWVTNDSEVSHAIVDSNNLADCINLGERENTKTLGLIWNSKADHFAFNINPNSSQKVTKRSILSEISQIFDPLGLLGPCIIIAKMIMQALWREKMSWDESVPLQIHTRWVQFRSELIALNELKISRHITCPEPVEIQLHGFCDSSERAYGACIFVKSINREGKSLVRLLCAKTKVAPLKTITIPRLELCGALLLSHLADKVKKAINMPINDCIFWCDSTVVLGWLKTSPNLLQIFVGNRVTQIQDLTNIDSWRHVPTTDNPADLLTRGVAPSILKDLDFWWSGPLWLQENASEWPTLPSLDIELNDLPDLRKVSQSYAASTVEEFPLNNYSSLSKLQRIIGYCLRFKINSLKPKLERNTGILSTEEMNCALNCLIKIAQRESFPKELKALLEGRSLSILNLNPFVDNLGIIRVGGRLRHSLFEYHKRHPIVLSSKHYLTKLLFLWEHKRLLHAGPQMLLASLREKYWPLLGRNLARNIVHKCIVCFKAKPKVSSAILGDLPPDRVRPSPPFFVTGVDYAGPFAIKDRKGRGCKVSKSYLALFVCFATRAIHLEIVSDLSTEAFIACFRRFIARRGRPLRVFSDNGKNFVGTVSELRELGTFLLKNNSDLTQEMQYDGMTWNFIPAYAPHFGGIWEAGVKATKHHLKRVAGNTILTFEELYTLVVQIEAILNSRPISPLSSDPNDFAPLTPSHFLIGRALTTIPEEDFVDVHINRLSRFQLIQQMSQHFWNRWSKEYISEMQQRTKNKTDTTHLKINSMVLIKEDHQPPMNWKLGRICELHPGADGVPRVASIRTSRGVVKRAFSKICPLPFEDENKDKELEKDI